MSKNQEFVKIDKVDICYDGKVLVVKDLNLDIAEGEFITTVSYTHLTLPTKRIV